MRHSHTSGGMPTLSFFYRWNDVLNALSDGARRERDRLIEMEARLTEARDVLSENSSLTPFSVLWKCEGAVDALPPKIRSCRQRIDRIYELMPRAAAKKQQALDARNQAYAVYASDCASKIIGIPHVA